MLLINKSTKDNHLSLLYYALSLELGCRIKLVINFVRFLREREKAMNTSVFLANFTQVPPPISQSYCVIIKPHHMQILIAISSLSIYLCSLDITMISELTLQRLFVVSTRSIYHHTLEITSCSLNTTNPLMYHWFKVQLVNRIP